MNFSSFQNSYELFQFFYQVGIFLNLENKRIVTNFGNIFFKQDPKSYPRIFLGRCSNNFTVKAPNFSGKRYFRNRKKILKKIQISRKINKTI